MAKCAFGIDLGTTFSSICLFQPLSNKFDIIKDKRSQSCIPSVVFFQENQDPIFGNFAIQYKDINPQSFIYDTKRMLGHRFDDPNIQKMRGKWPFKIEKSKNNHILIYFGEPKKYYYPYTISGEILKYLMSLGNSRLPSDQPIKDVVITIPANFGDYQRSETRKAAEYAGLNVLQIINEPTAAAIAYGLQEGTSVPLLALIFDFGGGTLDISLLSIEKEVIKVIGTDGDMFLGGRDFDEKTTEYLLKKMSIQDDDEELKNKARDAAVNAKIDLSSDEVANVILDKTHFCTLTLKEFEEVNKELIDRILFPVERILKHAEKNKEQIDKIILVGGSSNMNFVKTKLNGFFGKQPYFGIDPLEAVVTGASIIAAKMVNGAKLPKMISNIKFFDICPFSIGTLLFDGSVDVLIDKGKMIPISKDASYHTIFYKQKKFTVNICEVENDNPENYRYLGNFTLNLPISEKFIHFIITFSLDSDCILSASARIVNSDTFAKTKIDITKTYNNLSHSFEKVREEAILSKNLSKFIKGNIDAFRKFYEKNEIDDLLNEANKLKEFQLTKSQIRKTIKDWKEIKFCKYFNGICQNADDCDYPDFFNTEMYL